MVLYFRHEPRFNPKHSLVSKCIGKLVNKAMIITIVIKSPNFMVQPRVTVCYMDILKKVKMSHFSVVPSFVIC